MLISPVIYFIIIVMIIIIIVVVVVVVVVVGDWDIRISDLVKNPDGTDI